MKILIITQAVDIQDTTLGFFHTWIEKFSQRCQSVEVICLREGEHHLPKNVSVYSLRDRPTMSQWSIGKKFLALIWTMRHDYDVVFVHMNQEYILLGGILWRLWNKKIIFWRNHRHGDFFTCIAVFFSDTVLYTSTHSFTARYKKGQLMPAGIDVDMFKENTNRVREKNSLLMFGRISPVKHIETGIDMVTALRQKGIPVSLSIIGDVLSKDQGYVATLKDRSEANGVTEYVRFEKGVSFERAPEIYQRHELLLNFTPSGSFDKTVFEALACGMKVLVSNTSMKDFLPDDMYTNGNLEESVRKIQSLLNFDEKQSLEYGEEIKNILKRQSLDMLTNKLFLCISQEIPKEKK